MLACLTLVEVFADAEDWGKACCKCKVDFLHELCICLTIVLSALRVSEDGVFAGYGFEHIH